MSAASKVRDVQWLHGHMHTLLAAAQKHSDAPPAPAHLLHKAIVQVGQGLARQVLRRIGGGRGAHARSVDLPQHPPMHGYRGGGGGAGGRGSGGGGGGSGPVIAAA